MDRFVRHFHVYRYDTAFHAHQYLQGLYQCGNRKNMDKLALEQVSRALNLGVQFGWVLADAGYGKGPDFLFGLDDMIERFLVDVHKDFIVYKADPCQHVPRKTGLNGKGYGDY